MEKFLPQADRPKYGRLDLEQDPHSQATSFDEADEEQGFISKVSNRSSRRQIIWRHYSSVIYIVILGLLLLTSLSLWSKLSKARQQLEAVTQFNDTHPTSAIPSNSSHYTDLSKPDGVPIIGVIFYGRRENVDILDCYMQQNLARNGGLLDEVIFLEHTENKADIAWLDELITKVPEYRKVGTPPGGWDLMWTALDQHDAIYVKIDDDLAWIHEDAIPRLVHSLLKHPNAYAMSANMINSPEGNWLHYHTGAIRPFLPETTKPAHPANATSWRVSELPAHDDSAIPEHYELFQDPPYAGHRWLPLPMNMHNLHRTPIEHAQYDAFGDGWHSWGMAAQQHYSLIANIEDDTLSRYYLGGDESIWNMQWERYSINFLAMWGSAINATSIVGDDEEQVSIANPRELERPFLVDTHALASHFSFGTQSEMMAKTDLLDRYRNMANELVCARDNQKKAFVHEPRR